MTNPPNSSLSLNNVINVSVIAPGAQLGVPNMSALAFITQALAPAGWSSGQTYGIYTSPVDVAQDFGTSSDMAAMANAVFAQSPNILTGGGYLVIIPRLQSPSLESVQDCLVRMSDTIFFEGFCIDEEMGAQVSTFIALSNYVQGVGQQLFFYTSSNIADLQPGSLLDQVRAAGNSRTRCLYYGEDLTNSQTQVFSAAYAGRGMSINFAGANTVLSMQLQTLATIEPDQTINQASFLAAQTAGVCNGWDRIQTHGQDSDTMGWLVGIKKADFFIDALPLGGIITARAENTYSFENLREVACELHMDTQLIGRATLQLFQANQ